MKIRFSQVQCKLTQSCCSNLRNEGIIHQVGDYFQTSNPHPNDQIF